MGGCPQRASVTERGMGCHPRGAGGKALTQEACSLCRRSKGRPGSDAITVKVPSRSYHRQSSSTPKASAFLRLLSCPEY